MQRRLCVEIGDWKVVMVPAPLNRYQRWWYYKGKAVKHDTCELMTEDGLRAMLLSKIEEAEHDNRDS